MSSINCDVLVVGGGVAGAVAAIGAARQGAATLLVERSFAPGGTGTAALLRYICGLYVNGPETPPDTLNDGITREVVSTVRALTPTARPRRIGRVHVLPYSAFMLRHVLGSLIAAEPLVKPFFKSIVTGVETTAGGRIGAATLFRAGENIRIEPRTVVDATGDGDLGFMAGADFEESPSDRRQMAGYTVRLKGIGVAAGKPHHGQDESLALRVPFLLASLVKIGKFPDSFRFTHYSPGDHPDEGYIKFSISEPVAGPERDRTAEELIIKAVEQLGRELPAFRGASVVEASEGVMDREGRRLRGRYTLTEEDVLSGRRFEDGVVRNSWPIELWLPGRGPSYRFVEDGLFHEIPLGCLVSGSMDNLFMAGRCISASQEAHGSARVMGPSMATGEFAGRAAAFLSKEDRLPDVKKEEDDRGVERILLR